jgi:hypothetical protein
MRDTTDREAGAGDGAAPERRLSGGETAFWYGFAGVSYVGASLLEKGLLNWFVGPLWLVVVVCAGPALVDRVRPRRGSAAS